MNPFSSDKILRHPERLTEWMRSGHTSTPIGFDLHLTDSCPHNCPDCNGNRAAQASLSKREALAILSAMWDAGTKAVHFNGGGEPLVHPDCIEIIGWAKTQGYSVGLLTNLYRLQNGWPEALKESCAWIRVSMNGATADEYARRHGVSSDRFQETCSNIAELASASGDATVGVGYLTHKDSRGRILPMADLAARLGVDYIQFRPKNWDRCDLRAEIEGARAQCSIPVYGAVLKYAAMQEDPTYSVCHGSHFWTVITAEGKIRVCCETADPNSDVGYWSQPISDLWASAKSVINGVNLAQCPPTCRMSANNMLLEKIAHPIVHELHI